MKNLFSHPCLLSEQYLSVEKIESSPGVRRHSNDMKIPYRQKVTVFFQEPTDAPEPSPGTVSKRLCKLYAEGYYEKSFEDDANFSSAAFTTALANLKEE